MKRALALGLAAMMAASTVAITTAEAKHDGWKGGDWNYKYKKKFKKKHNDFNPVVPFLFGSFVGLAVGSALAAPPPPYPYPAYGPYYGDPHVHWCRVHYPNTYNPATNTYYKWVGVPAVCISPYGPY